MVILPDVLRVANTSVAHAQRAHPGEIDKTVREWFAQHGIPFNITESVDVTENIAAVKLRLECQDVRYIDYFHMMRIGGRWWIVHKMSVGLDKRVGQG